ncbi:MAG: putative chaperone CsaA [Fimbriimonadaceae bacterium]|nr:putative chaperone CsaA [Fimbriimonadaceae bacterium]
MTAYDAFQQVDMRLGRILRAEPNEAARKPSYKMWIDFGSEIGERTSSAQLTDLYQPEDLVGRLVIAAVNFGERSIAGFPSQVLVLGVPGPNGEVILLQPERDAPLGAKVF